MKEITNILLSYFAGFGISNIEQISEHFHEDVQLSDWNETWSGKEKVIAAISEMVNSSTTIISPKRISIDEELNRIVAVCPINIFIDNKYISAIDNIAFIKDDGKWKIYSINAILDEA